MVGVGAGREKQGTAARLEAVEYSGVPLVGCGEVAKEEEEKGEAAGSLPPVLEAEVLAATTAATMAVRAVRRAASQESEGAGSSRPEALEAAVWAVMLAVK